MGYATEAVRGFLAHYWELKREIRVLSDEHVGEDVRVEESLKGETDPANIASHRVLEKRGFEKGKMYSKGNPATVGGYMDRGKMVLSLALERSEV